ncbi:hypothetical protein [Terracoccus luteus]|uniref:Uncharacterized protein n=1 Tax=Terracoccus luteus TaxID=53356 RepID=A0A839PRB9_9MICO|nr:hypothetical protein [Terracoccus luteus]MBB2986730.1 hypothetical protein [Terracoccus luteus]MCP2172381.1 hypothetical protein [Terracoccus luteus]
MTTDPGAGDLLDPDLHEEIELVSDLVVAASGTSRHFTAAEVDVLLGVVPQNTDAIAAKPTRRALADRAGQADPAEQADRTEQPPSVEGEGTTTEGPQGTRPGGTASDPRGARHADRADHADDPDPGSGGR